LLTIKPVGSIKSFFDNDEYTIDVKNCIDVLLYIQSMHPRLGLFMKQAESFETVEDMCFLDKNGEIIDPQTFLFHKFKEDDILYIAPVIVGAGGKAGTVVMIVALVVVAIYAPQLIAMMGPQAGMGAVAAEVSLAAGGSFLSAGATSFLTSVITNIAISMALSLVQSLFTSTPKARTREITKDSGTRSQNDVFGSLVNSTSSSTPIALNYGQMRVGGQFLSGYILSQQHAQNDSPSVASIFNANQSPLSTDAQEAV